jgi:hypothetical protein
MPAFDKIALVTPVFHLADLAFVHAWSRHAPGIGGWRVLVDDQQAPENVAVIPPGAEEPVFFITRQAAKAVLARRPWQAGPEAPRVTLGTFDTLRQAVLALCELPGEALQDIQEDLEREFPRWHRR